MNLTEAEWSKISKEADKVNPLWIGDPRAKVWERAHVNVRDARTVDATMLESQRNIHERK